MRKPFLKKHIGILISLLTISLGTVGFSSWMMVENNSYKLESLNMIAGDTKDLKNYILFNKTEQNISNPTYNLPTPLSFNSKGIVNNGLVEKTGSCSFYFALRLKGENGIYDLNKNLTTFSLSLKVINGNNDAMLNYINPVINFNISNTKVGTSSYQSTLDSNNKTALICDNANLLNQENIFYQVFLTFDFTEVVDFSSTIYPLLQNFNINISINKAN